MVTRWTLMDPSVPETWTFQLNPKEGGTPATKRNFTQQATTAPDGLTLVYEGQEGLKPISISGTILTQQQLADFNKWWNTKHNQVRLTDDLGRQFWVITETFTPVRKHSTSHPWRHDYTATFLVVVPPS